jgi:hypothetical protein
LKSWLAKKKTLLQIPDRSPRPGWCYREGRGRHVAQQPREPLNKGC